MLERRDYVMRLVRQLAETLARILALALQDPKRARAQLAEAAREALGTELSPLTLVDPRSAADALATPERVFQFALLLETAAELDALEGAMHRARRGFTHALEMSHEVLRLDDAHPGAKPLQERLRLRLEGR